MVQQIRPFFECPGLNVQFQDKRRFSHLCAASPRFPVPATVQNIRCSAQLPGHVRIASICPAPLNIYNNRADDFEGFVLEIHLPQCTSAGREVLHD